MGWGRVGEVRGGGARVRAMGTRMWAFVWGQVQVCGALQTQDEALKRRRQGREARDETNLAESHDPSAK